MSDSPPTLVLEIGDLDAKTRAFPLRLIQLDQKGAREKAIAWIPEAKFDLAAVAKELAFDPIETFREEDGVSDSFEKIGHYLYDLLSQTKVKREWDNLKKQHDRLRVLLDIKPKWLASFPWELVRDETNILSVNTSQTFVRSYSPDKLLKKPLGDCWPLRVLILIGARPDDARVLPWKEVRLIEDALHKADRQEQDNKLVHRVVDIEVLANPTLERLRAVYGEFKPHIFHFIGHGELAPNLSAHLIIQSLDPKTNKYEEIKWTPPQIRTTLQTHARIGLPSFVLVNACRSEVAGTKAEDARQAWSIGDVFRSVGVPAVLTMQTDINGEVAGVFAGALYKALAELDPLDVAVAHARNAISDHVKSLEKREWAIPVLTIATPPEDVLQFKPTAAETRLAEIKDCAIFNEISCFSDRVYQRRKLIRGFYPLPPQTADRDLIVVHGQKDSGKSWLARWCMEACALLNNDIRYVEVGGMETKTWFDVLLQIRDGDDTKNNSLLINSPLDPTAFRRFNWELEHRFNGKEPPNIWDETEVPPRKIKLSDPGAKWPEQFAKNTFESFRQAIIQAAQVDNPLIIVLDHFTKNAGITVSDMDNYLIPFLIRPVAQRQFRDENESRTVKFVLVMTEEEFKNFKIAEKVSGFYDVEAPLFEADTFAALLTEHLRRMKPDLLDKNPNAVDVLMAMLDKKTDFSFTDLISIPGMKR